MSNGVFNFNFLALLLSEILGGSQIYTRGLYALWTPLSEKFFLPKASTSSSEMDMTSYFRSGSSDLDEIRYPDAE